MQVLWACFFVAALAATATAAGPRSLLEDASASTSSIEIPLPFSDDGPAMPNIEEATTEAAPEGAHPFLLSALHAGEREKETLICPARTCTLGNESTMGIPL